MGADRRGRRAAGESDGSAAAGLLWRGEAVGRRRATGRRRHRQQRFHPSYAGGQAAWRTLLATLRRRPRPRPGRTLVGAGRPRPGAVGGWLCAGEPPRPLARLSQPLQRDERPASGLVLRRVAQRLGRSRRPQRSAHLSADTRPVSARPISNRPISRGTWASCWSKATIWSFATAAPMCAPSPG